jgi:nicotinamide mononucleotide adenylyltransferase
MSNKRDSEDAPHIGSGRIGLVVMRAQPLHRGHAALINLMRSDCDIGIVAFGSTQLSRVVRNPFTFEQRVEMLRAVFAGTVKPLPLVDIDSNVNTDDWVDYVLDKIRKLNLPLPTDYYSGSISDAKWYVNRFARLTDPVTEVGFVKSYQGKEGRRLHIMDRSLYQIPPAEEIRSLIERRDDEWKQYVPARLANYIEWNYPPELRVALTSDKLPADDAVPVGTRCKVGNDLHRLHDDGKWRVTT